MFHFGRFFYSVFYLQYVYSMVYTMVLYMCWYSCKKSIFLNESGRFHKKHQMWKKTHHMSIMILIFV